MSKFKVSKESVGLRLDIFLQSKLKDTSRSQIQKNIKIGLWLVNGKAVAPHYFLRNNDIIEIEKQRHLEIKGKKNFVTPIFGPDVLVKIIAETPDYLVINKPVGILVHPDGVHNEMTLVDWLIQKYPKVKKIYDHENKTGKERPGIVHRLDKDVSGLMVIAKTQKMFDNLKNQFRNRIIKKEYLALVYGVINLDNGRIDRALGRSEKTGLMSARTDNNSGKEAITEFEVIKRFKNYTLLKVKLLTGRTHQIRAHLKSIGHSIVGDRLYQTRDVRTQLKNRRSNFKNIFLYSAILGFYDLTNNWQEFKLKEPKWWQEFLESLRN